MFLTKENSLKMKLFIISALLFVIASCTSYRAPVSGRIDSALDRLDKTLTETETHEYLKKERINSLQSRAKNTSGSESMYWLLDEIYHEYNRYDLDSTARYASLKMSLAKNVDNEQIFHDAVLDIADMYIMSGMYHEAFELIENTDYDRLEAGGFLPRYYHLMNTLYGGFAHTSNNMSLHNKYENQRYVFRSKLYDCLGEDDIARLYLKSEMLIDSCRYDEAINELKDRITDKAIAVHDRAIVNYMLGLAYKGKGDIDNAIISYTESSICDLTTPIRDYKSLYELAGLLYDRGDFERASKYITRSIKDADAASIHINIESINSLLPVIYNSYNASIKKRSHIQNILLIGISLLLIMLTVTTGITFKDKKKIKAKEKEVRESNIELTKANARLQKYIDRLKESNEIKETYISRYIDLCSDYIGRLDKYRSELRRLSRNGGYEALQKELRSTDIIDKELSDFYAQFDATFLDLFPDFISQLNSLMKPDRQIETKDGLLTTELRVCALIRLGVTDSVKISEFLRRSVSTIYNYRVKMRNSATNGREDFENEIMKIGKLS